MARIWNSPLDDDAMLAEKEKTISDVTPIPTGDFYLPGRFAAGCTVINHVLQNLSQEVNVEEQMKADKSVPVSDLIESIHTSMQMVLRGEVHGELAYRSHGTVSNPLPLEKAVFPYSQLDDSRIHEISRKLNYCVSTDTLSVLESIK